ncbi:hypothetical protein PCANC_21780 [Puccinia coronata f. sp. avenae]|uniref:Uncharacterized protein n=1 Tax=Puccinia coronata f. sp. avenae TaxID=200324 RepID=A0A2N5TTI4_9BASI|nr:hypothetical protein PCANC_21780 [Puccinia coronata f. sp. avenae]
MALVSHQFVELNGQNSPLPLFQSSWASPVCFENLITALPAAGINRSNTAVQAVLEQPPLKQPCLTGGWTGTVRPKQEPTGRTDLSNRSRLVLCKQLVPGTDWTGLSDPPAGALVKQCLSNHRLNSACPTTGQTRLFEHRSNCRV